MMFDAIIRTRMREDELNLIQKAVKQNRNYDSVSHYVRCCILKELRKTFPKEMETLNKSLKQKYGGEF